MDETPEGLLHRVGFCAFAHSGDFAEQIGLAVFVAECTQPASLLDHVQYGERLHCVGIVTRALFLHGAQGLRVSANGIEKIRPNFKELDSLRCVDVHNVGRQRCNEKPDGDGSSQNLEHLAPRAHVRWIAAKLNTLFFSEKTSVK